MTDIVNNILLVIIGVGAGIFTAAGAVTVITVVGMVPRFATRTSTENRLRHYENCIFWGIVTGNLCSMYGSFIVRIKPLQGYYRWAENHCYLPLLFIFLYGVIIGVYVGCIALSIAEMTEAIPIMTEKLKYTAMAGVGGIILAIAAGKFFGVIFFFFT